LGIAYSNDDNEALDTLSSRLLNLFIHPSTNHHDSSKTPRRKKNDHPKIET